MASWQLDPNTDTVTWSEEFFSIFGGDPNLPPPRYSEHSNLFVPESWARLDAAAQDAL